LPVAAYYTIQAKNAESKSYTRYLDPNSKEFDERFNGRKHGLVSEHIAKSLAVAISQEQQIPLKIVGRSNSGLPVNELIIGEEFDIDRTDVRSFLEIESKGVLGFDETPLRHKTHDPSS
jgi:hypothetical protein